MELILASQSPRRRELLERMGLTEFRIRVPEIDERMDRELPPGELVRQIAGEKARAVAALSGVDAIVVAADTVVALDNALLGKPDSPAQAREMLSALSGRRHQVYTGLAVLRGEEAYLEYEVTDVTFRPLAPAEIDAYVATGEPMDKAGAYGIQGYGALLVEGIEGDYYNVMGLPICRLGKILARLGLDCMRQAADRRQADVGLKA